jgi:filamentous hemagglutinin
MEEGIMGAKLGLSRWSFWTKNTENSAVRLFENQFPEHALNRPNLISPSQLKNISGRFNYVVDEHGNLVVGRISKIPGGGHIDLADGNPVRAAGEIKVLNGQIKSIDNSSGHYLPSGSSAQTSAEVAFSQLGFDTIEKYIEKLWFDDPSMQNGGAWRMQQ